MATQTLPAKYDELTGERAIRPSVVREPNLLRDIVYALASLKLTVILMGMALFLIFVGTLAQAKLGMWEVLDKYFSSAIVWINIQVLFPPSFFPNGPRPPEFYVPYFGGASIGVAMIVNLLAAHTIRFKIQAKGARLLIGVGVSIAAVIFTGLIITMGHSTDGLQGKPFFDWIDFWNALKFAMVVAWFLLWYPLVRLLRGNSQRYIEAVVVSAAIDGLAVLLVWLISSKAQLDMSNLRILWQLLQGTLAGLFLLGGGWLLFRKRAPIVLIHAGILLMMAGQYFATAYNVEERMLVVEGQTKNYAEDIRVPELAVIDPSPSDHNKVTVIPDEVLQRSLSKGSMISNEQLPFDIKVVKYLPNSSLRRLKKDDKNPATAGLGTVAIADELETNSGASADGKVDLPAAYLEIFTKDGKGRSETQTYLTSVEASTGMTRLPSFETIEANGKPYQVSLRFKRSYKPYSVKLLDITRLDYKGTDTPRDFASIVEINLPSKKVQHEAKIWMNNPLRFAGETFYQSRYEMRGPNLEASEFQIVRNAGWMTPYVSCMIVVVGLIAHFWGSLIRFLIRREQELYGKPATDTENPYEAVVVGSQQHRPARRNKPAKANLESDSATPSSRAWFRASRDKSGTWRWAVTIPVVSLGAIFLFSPFLNMKLDDSRGFNLDELARLPVLHEGRVKPLDTLARNTMLIVSNRTSFKDKNKERQPAIRWMLDVISGAKEGYDHQVIRIDNPEVLDTLDLRRRKGLRYSLNEVAARKDKLGEELHQAFLTSQKGEPLSVYQKKIYELNRRIDVYMELERAFETPDIPDEIPMSRLADQRVQMGLKMVFDDAFGLPTSPEDRAEELRKRNARPRVIPTEDGQWKNAKLAWAESYQAKLAKQLDPAAEEKVNEAALTFHAMMKAYAKGDANTFNSKLEDFKQQLGVAKPGDYRPNLVNFELSFNRVAPFFHAQWTYFVAMLLTFVAMLLWSRSLNSASFWLIVLTLFVHTCALGSRMWISGHAPITNLYSSAIFIGWAGVILGIFIEVLFRLGIGNLLSSIAGFSTLIIASFLANGGETMPALQAVLDTQFWLSTHVVIVALGYIATFAAGVLGVIYICIGLLTRVMDATVERILIRMIYGVLCFALLFSFFGTVLGGLWADDSWGRFWGWDPKENGALIIVLWNALVLHARWDRIVSNRGFAALAVGGNIATAWSWFGVNELGVGLHSYGFTEGVLFTLSIFVVTQLLVMSATLLPKHLWRSREAFTAE